MAKSILLRSVAHSVLLGGCLVSVGLAGIAPSHADEIKQPSPPQSSSSGPISEGPEIQINSTPTKDRQQAIEQERQSPIVEDILLADEIRRLPDVNLAEALQRIPGVSLETDSGQGRFINIRGMDTDLNGTYFDGVHLTASGNSQPLGGGRGVAMDVFPSGPGRQRRGYQDSDA